MANDRMYIRCKGCGDLHFLAKCYDDGYFTTHEGEELRQGLDDFFDRHKWCYRHKYYGGFELVYESDEDSESEDERMLRTIIRGFEAWKGNGNVKFNNTSVDDILAYLEKQKEQKQEWSEEDEEMLDIVLTMVDCSTVVPHSGGQLHPSESYKKDISEWLKSCRPSWKPSEEQQSGSSALKAEGTNE